MVFNWRLWVAVGFLSLLPILYGKGRIDGRKLERLETASAIAAANDKAREIEKLRQRSVDAAITSARAREARILVDAAHVRDVADGLRGTLDAVEQASKQSADAAARSVSALRAVFDACRAEYAAVGADAALHASDSLTLQQAWPK